MKINEGSRWGGANSGEGHGDNFDDFAEEVGEYLVDFNGIEPLDDSGKLYTMLKTLYSGVLVLKKLAKATVNDSEDLDDDIDEFYNPETISFILDIMKDYASTF